MWFNSLIPEMPSSVHSERFLKFYFPVDNSLVGTQFQGLFPIFNGLVRVAIHGVDVACMFHHHLAFKAVRVVFECLVDVNLRLRIPLFKEKQPRIGVEIGAVVGFFLHSSVAHGLGLI